MITEEIKMLRNLPFLEGASPDVMERLAEGGDREELPAGPGHLSGRLHRARVGLWRD